MAGLALQVLSELTEPHLATGGVAISLLWDATTGTIPDSATAYFGKNPITAPAVTKTTGDGVTIDATSIIITLTRDDVTALVAEFGYGMAYGEVWDGGNNPIARLQLPIARSIREQV